MPHVLKKLRTYTGFASAWITHLGVFGLFQRRVCTPGFACHGCPWGTFACPIGVMAHGSAVRTLPVLALATVLSVGVAVGRLVCGFACPFGWLQDLLYRIPAPKIRLPRFVRYGKYLALLLLVFMLPYILGQQILGYVDIERPAVDKTDNGGLNVTVKVTNKGETPVAGIDLTTVFQDADSNEEVFRSPKPVHFNDVLVPGQDLDLPPFEVPNMLGGNKLVVESPQTMLMAEPKYGLYYCKVCPVGTLTSHLPKYSRYYKGDGRFDAIYGRAGNNALRLGILAGFLMLMVVSSRPFCRSFCPLGALYALCARFAVVRISVDRDSCVNCGLCDKVCPVDLDVRREAGGPECIACGDCITACPRGSIARKIGF